MNNVLVFAEEQHKILMEEFLKQGFGFLDFPEATMYITLNSVIAANLLKKGVLFAPTEKQLLDASRSACDDIIRFFQGYKAKLK